MRIYKIDGETILACGDRNRTSAFMNWCNAVEEDACRRCVFNPSQVIADVPRSDEIAIAGMFILLVNEEELVA